mmetsp:Transcript_86787/g.281020  ORF Transcript_86787/g.281020 Transcript_86787/m.281020 type:complete len:246 (+) Transcript_86787:641-1378(+)
MPANWSFSSRTAARTCAGRWPAASRRWTSDPCSPCGRAAPCWRCLERRPQRCWPCCGGWSAAGLRPACSAGSRSLAAGKRGPRRARRPGSWRRPWPGPESRSWQRWTWPRCWASGPTWPVPRRTSWTARRSACCRTCQRPPPRPPSTLARGPCSSLGLRRRSPLRQRRPRCRQAWPSSGGWQVVRGGSSRGGSARRWALPPPPHDVGSGPSIAFVAPLLGIQQGVARAAHRHSQILRSGPTGHLL